MEKRFVYFYFMKKEMEKIRPVVPLHVSYWHDLNPPYYIGGPFVDRTGGLITFGAIDIAHAEKIVASDPFVSHDLIDRKWIKEWATE